MGTLPYSVAPPSVRRRSGVPAPLFIPIPALSHPCSLTPPFDPAALLARTLQAVGQLMVVVEWCMWEVIKFVVLFFIFNVGFTLAFYTTAKGSTAVLLGTATTVGWLSN